jgi:hypothetical protein
MDDFKKTLTLAKMGDDKAVQQIIDMYRWLVVKESSVDGVFDQDLMQQLYKTVLACIRAFEI